MRIVIIIISAIALLAGALFIFFPGILLKLGKNANTVLFSDNYFLKNSVSTGTVLIVAGIYLLLTYAVN
ncbi:MAG: hypothetical protein HQ528_06155 [Candidatus Marinimicrobia bacterium]|nr:hypothetical protein [Candidatus Neomarinimicrobiota bacterium]